MSSSGPSKIDVILQLPFVHCFSDEELANSDVAVVPWVHWLSRVAEDDLPDVADYSYFFSPPLQRLLFPEFHGKTAFVTPPAHGAMTCRQYRENLDATGTYQIGQYQETSVRLTRQGWPANSGASLRMRASTVEREVPLAIKWIDALLLPQRVGVLLLAVTVEVVGGTAEAAGIMRALKKRSFRRRLTVATPELFGKSERRTTWKELVHRFLVGLVDEANPSARDMVFETFGANFTYVAVSDYLNPGDSNGVADGLRGNTFALATGHSNQGYLDSYTRSGMNRLFDRQGLDTWSNWSVLFYDGSMALSVLRGGRELEDGYITVLRNCESAYALILAIVLAQRTKLHLLMQEVKQTPVSLRRGLRHLEQVGLQMVRFRRVLWHEHLTTAPVGSQIHELLTLETGVTRLSEFVLQEFEIVQNRLDAQRRIVEDQSRRRVAIFLEILTVVGIPLGVYAASAQPLLNKKLDEVTNGSADLAVLGGGVLGVLSLLALLAIRLRWRRHSEGQ